MSDIPVGLITYRFRKLVPDQVRIPVFITIIAAFVTYHLLHFTFGSVHPDFVEGSVYHNVVVGFQNRLVAGAYIVAMGVLGLHLYHGLWSTLQTLGASSPVYNRFRRPVAAARRVLLRLCST